MTDDDAYEAHRDQREMGPAHHSEPDAPAVPEPITVYFCATCHLFHNGFTACAVARAAVDALMIEIGEELRDDDLEGVDRPALLNALRVRGISLEPDGANWRAVATVAP